MADERGRPPYHQPSPIGFGRCASRSLREHEPSPQQPLRGLVVPTPYAWPALLAKDGDACSNHYRHTLEELGEQPGTLGLIFAEAGSA